MSIFRSTGCSSSMVARFCSTFILFNSSIFTKLQNGWLEVCFLLLAVLPLDTRLFINFGDGLDDLLIDRSAADTFAEVLFAFCFGDTFTLFGACRIGEKIGCCCFLLVDCLSFCNKNRFKIFKNFYIQNQREFFVVEKLR